MYTPEATLSTYMHMPRYSPPQYCCLAFGTWLIVIIILWPAIRAKSLPVPQSSSRASKSAKASKHPTPAAISSRSQLIEQWCVAWMWSWSSSWSSSMLPRPTHILQFWFLLLWFFSFDFCPLLSRAASHFRSHGRREYESVASLGQKHNMLVEIYVIPCCRVESYDDISNII